MSGFNPRDLIHEIKIRPGIYDKDALVPPRRDHKHQLWLEVAERLTPSEDWESYTDIEKDARIDEIAAKWKHLRTNFHRDVKLEEAGESNKKRKYIHYKDLEFMRPFVGCRLPRRRDNSIDSTDDTDDVMGDDTDIDMDSFLKASDNVEEVETKVTVDNSTIIEGRPKSKRVVKPTPKALQSKASSSPPAASRVHKDANVKNFDVPKKPTINSNPSFKIRDGDISFCLSLVPTLRKLGDGRKLRAKIEILKVLHRYVDHIERRNLVARNNVSNNHNTTNVKQNADIEDDMAEDHLEEYEEGVVIIKNEENDDPLNGNTKTWWT